MGEILLGLVMGVIGLVILFMGYRFARFLLPLWGFISGFMLGASIIADSSSSTFLGTFFGILVGLGLGLVFALLIYAYYYAAIVLLGAATGYWLGASFIGLFGIDPGFLTAVAGLLVGALFGVFAILLNLPKAFLIIMTSFGGAIVLVAAVMLVFDVIPNDYLSYDTVITTVNNSFFWWITTFILATIGITTQLTLEKEFELVEWNMLQEASSKKKVTSKVKTETKE